jgi:glycosyltransferase involved in cell wall biosynthesis
MRIRQVNTFDRGGGAESVVSRLHGEYRRRGHEALLSVKRRRGGADGVSEIDETLGHGAWAGSLLKLSRRPGEETGRPLGAGAWATGLRALARPRAALERWCGWEDFRFASSRHLAAWGDQPPDVVQCHNLHGNYFDLGALAELSRSLPVVLTLHDCWLLSGHCAHSFDCERWKTGCGSCPDLSIYPAIRRDASAYNWRRKRDIFRRGRLYVAAPSEWLMARVEKSILMEGAVETRVIPNGIDDAFFADVDAARARRTLGFEDDAVVLLFVANSIRGNEWKDFAMLKESAMRLADLLADRRVHLVALGEGGEDEPLGNGSIRFVPFIDKPALVAAYYQAADVYLHAARVETFSLTIAEAMACATPVVAADTGAVAERIVDLNDADSDTATGIMVAAADARAMTEATARLLGDTDLRRRLGANGRQRALRDYRTARQAEAYLNWFADIVDSRPKEASP